jgi:bifunctional non-homologous end joining protein LigD
MTLLKYKAKRNFKKSPEPIGEKAKSSGKLRFVVQKHDASHIHYDFRLELDGVLKSWAVPKGPSMDPSVKRLAMMVEDHPYDYRSFEGVIPNGYGAGTVMIWDEGFYEPAEMVGENKNKQEKNLTRSLRAGKIHFILYGKKLKGEFAIIKTRFKGENSWLLFKVKDNYANTADITLKDKSVVSKKTLTQIKKTAVNLDSSDPTKKKAEKAKKKLSSPKQVDGHHSLKQKKYSTRKKNAAAAEIKMPLGAKKAKFPHSVKPMLAVLVNKPFDKKGWIYEVKWDGYRAISMMRKSKVEIKSRNGKSFSDKFYPVTSELKKLKLNAVMDGEIVALDKNGISDFGNLQNWRSEKDGELYYYIFDVLWLNGYDLTQTPLVERKAILEKLIPENDVLKISRSFNESGISFFKTAKKLGLEGIIAKKSDSYYLQGERSGDWLKIKANKRQEMVIGGFTKNVDSNKYFSSLLVGFFDHGKLKYSGKVGTGFNAEVQKDILQKLKPLIVKTPPFVNLSDFNSPSRFRPNPPHALAIWVKPKLICEVSFTEITRDGVMRHPSFVGMRIDKNAKNVVMEKAKTQKKPPVERVKTKKKKESISIDKKENNPLLNPLEETVVKKINGHDLKFTNLGKIYWPVEKITKRDLLNYYHQVTPYILPYLINRPQSMNRHPNGINGPGFYFKDVTGKAPEWVETFLYHSESDDRDRKYLVAKNEASILYMASLGCIEMNPWHSRVESEDYPDWCIIDLDPGKNTFDEVIKAARVTKEVLDGLGVVSYPKTSGSTGIHIYVPLGASYTYDQSKEFARVIARMVHEEIPEFTSIERIVKNRKGKMYIDFLQNRPQATVCAPYSVRPRPGATVSMPLHWEEVKKGMKMRDFTIKNCLERIKSEGDIFKQVIGKGVDLLKVIDNFTKSK